MRWAVNRRSNAARQPGREISSSRPTASTASSIVETANPVSPSSRTSGTEPWRKAITGVPQAIASIITSPNGSGQLMGKSTAWAFPRKLCFSVSPISPTKSTCRWASNGSMTSS